MILTVDTTQVDGHRQDCPEHAQSLVDPPGVAEEEVAHKEQEAHQLQKHQVIIDQVEKSIHNRFEFVLACQ